MRKAALLTIANFGSAFAALQFYNQCGGGAYTGDTTCPSGSTCVEASKWYSQCIPDAKAGPSPKAAALRVPQFPEAPGSGSGNQNGGENDENASLPPIVSAPAEEADESSKKPVETPIDGPVANPTEAPVANPDAGSGSGSGAGGITRTIPASSGASAADTAIPVSGEFDGKMTYYDRSPAVCQDQVETGEADAMFILEDGATLRNVIIGPGQAEGVHCKGTCTLENVWFEDVCEDAITLKQKSGTSTIRGGGAFHAADKVVQFNGRGTVEISDFYVEDYGKLVRSCGNCKDNGGPRNVVIDNVAAVNGGVLCGSKNCDLFEGNSDGSEPSKLSSGPDGTSCRADNFSETC
ncbi:Cellulose-binding domain, fungal [Fusarium oxysporum f. sp. vasinfectum]|nr:Cellulose-binding domain, fungal [Fusarium oxysporum f. sp. vasinfectum]